MLTKNLTPFAFGTKVCSRRPPQPEMTIAVRGTYSLAADGTLTVVDDSVERGPVTGDLFYEDERENECIHASDFADFKLSAEVLLTGSCYAPGGKAISDCPVELSVGDWKKALHVFGDRRWSATGIGKPEPFETLALGYRHAFGGPGYERNPVGKGYNQKELPNIEQPRKLIATPLDRPEAACFGPIHPDWPQRRARMGVQYGRAYLETRAPFYAEDFDWRYFSAAPADQQLEGFLRGDEPLRLVNLHPDAARVDSCLPGLRTRAFVEDVMGRFREVVMSLDTLLFETDERRLYLTWRGVDPVAEDDLEDVAFLLLAAEQLAEPPKSEEHYRAILDEFEADPVGLKADMPPEMLELAERMEQAGDGELPYPDASDQGNPVSTMLARQLGPFAAEMQRDLKEGIETARQEFQQGLDASAKAVGDAEPPSPEEIELTGQGAAAPLEQVDAPQEMISAQQGKFDEALEQAAEQELDTPPVPILPKPGAMPDPRLRPKMRGMFAQAAALREQAADEHTALQARAKLLAAADEIAQVPHDPRWTELDDEYAPPVEPIPDDEPGPGRNLSEQDLTGCDLSGRDLSGANLRATILTKANLSGANLKGANLHRAILYKTDLTEADLSGADLSRVNAGAVKAPAASFRGAILDEGFFEKANLEGADLSDATGSYQAFANAKLAKAKAQRCSLQRADFTGADLSGADFEGADLTRAELESCRARGASFTDAKLERASFRDTDAKNAKFIGIRGDKSIWLSAKLDGADFSYGTLVEAHLTKASAVEARFSFANLAESRLYRACLDRAEVEQANLFRADLCKARLTETSFVGSNLYDAKFLGAQGKGANFVDAILTLSTLERS